MAAAKLCDAPTVFAHPKPASHVAARAKARCRALAVLRRGGTSYSAELLSIGAMASATLSACWRKSPISQQSRT